MLVIAMSDFCSILTTFMETLFSSESLKIVVLR